MDQVIILNNVQFEEKEQAKKYKCQWNQDKKMWFITPKRYQQTPNSRLKEACFHNWMNEYPAKRKENMAKLSGL